MLGRQQPEVGARSHRPRSQVHQRGIGNVAVGKHAHINFVVANNALHLVFFQDGDAIGIELSRQLRRVLAPGDVGDLGSGERHHSVVRIVPEHDVEVMEIPACRAENQDIFGHVRTRDNEPYCPRDYGQGGSEGYHRVM